MCPGHQPERKKWEPLAGQVSGDFKRMLITCVLSQAEPGHPSWIKREIVSRPPPSRFSPPRDVCLFRFASNCCGGEIIQVHSGQHNPSILVLLHLQSLDPEVSGSITELKCSKTFIFLIKIWYPQRYFRTPETTSLKVAGQLILQIYALESHKTFWHWIKFWY